MFYTYVLKSRKDGNLYIGFSSDLKRRISEHNKGLVEITKNRRPFDLIYYEACLNKEKAVEREKVLKTGFGRSYLKRRL
jgi:putative endonuclease